MKVRSYAKSLWEKSLLCGNVYNEARLKDVFIESLYQSIRLSMRNLWSVKKHVTPQEVARETTSLAKLQEWPTRPEESSQNIAENGKSIQGEKKHEKDRTQRGPRQGRLHKRSEKFRSSSSSAGNSQIDAKPRIEVLTADAITYQKGSPQWSFTASVATRRWSVLSNMPKR